MLRYEMTRPSNTHQSYFIISLQCSYPQAIIFSSSSWSVIFIGQVLISQILGEIFAQDGAHPPDPAKPEPVLIIDEYFVSGLISSAVQGVRNNNKIINNKLECGDVVKCEVAA